MSFMSVLHSYDIPFPKFEKVCILGNYALISLLYMQVNASHLP